MSDSILNLASWIFVKLKGIPSKGTFWAGKSIKCCHQNCKHAVQRTVGQLLIFNLYVYIVSLHRILFIDFTVNHTKKHKISDMCPFIKLLCWFSFQTGGLFQIILEGGSLCHEGNIYTSKRSTRMFKFERETH